MSPNFNFGSISWMGSISWSSLVLLAAGLPLSYFFVLRPVYYVSFHPLAGYPGPKVFAASSLPWGVCFMYGHWHKKLMELHRIYGPVVRVGPDELSYSHPEAWDDIYGRHVPGGRMENGKPAWYTGPSDHDLSGAKLGDHGRMRRLLNPGFTHGAMYKHEPLIMKHIDTLMQRLREKARGGESDIDIFQWFTFCTFDIVGDLAFGEPFGCLRNSELHPYIEFIYAGNYIANLMTICKRLPFFHIFLPFKASMRLYEDFKRHSKLLRQVINRRLGKQSTRYDFLDIMTTRRGNLYMTDEEILKNAQLITAAGSETTASALTGLVYILATMPHIKEKIVNELQSKFASEDKINMRSVADLPYLHAAVKELLRYYPPGPNAFWRITPPGGNTILGDQIPGNTVVGIPHRVAYRNPKYWHRPDEFIPERWLPDGQEGEFARDCRGGFHPFSYGPRTCIAVNLAYAEMWFTLARFLWNFNVDVAPESRNWMDNQHAYLIWDKPPLLVHLTPRVPRVDPMGIEAKTQIQRGSLETGFNMFDQIKITKELHPNFGAEVSGVDFTRPVSEAVFEQILAAVTKYGVIVFRDTGLDDLGHVEFARRFGDLLDMRQYLPKDQKMRIGSYELADLSNIDPETGKPIGIGNAKAKVANATAFFHADLSYSQRRATFSILKAHTLPPPGHGGNTDFADTRTAFEELDEVEPGLKQRLLTKGYIGAHSWQHSQKMSNPALYKDLDPAAHDMAKHQVVQLHEPSGRMNLYIGSYMHHIEGPPGEQEDLALLQQRLMDHATQSKFQTTVEWSGSGDMILWDNRAVLHRAGPGNFAGKFVRDLRRATVLEALDWA